MSGDSLSAELWRLSTGRQEGSQTQGWSGGRKEHRVSTEGDHLGRVRILGSEVVGGPAGKITQDSMVGTPECQPKELDSILQVMRILVPV